MSEIASPPPPSQMPSAVSQRPLGGRLRRLVLKELREILRDRRTIITLVVMPILIYPLLAVVFQRFLVNAITLNEEVVYDIGVDSKLAQGILGQELQIGDSVLADREHNASKNRDNKSRNDSPVKTPYVDYTLVAYPDDTLIRHVADSTLHVAALYHKETDRKSGKGLSRPAQWELVYRPGSPTSEAALHFVESRLQAFNDFALNEQLKRMGIAVSLPAATTRHPISFAGAPAFSLAALIPLILVLMTVTGAVYPAIDLTAGERERGTLETLIAAPVPRLGLLLAKYVAVLTVAILTALVNLTAMTVGSSRVDLQACKLEYSIVSPK